MEHTNPKYCSFNDSAGSKLANFRPDIFTRTYGLKPARQPLNLEFSQASRTRFNFDEMLKYWINEPGKFSQRKDDLYPVTLFREPYSLLAAMLCRIYGPPN